jgi:hypothetical protein
VIRTSSFSLRLTPLASSSACHVRHQMVAKWKRLQMRAARRGDERTEYLIGHVHAAHRIFTAATTARLRRTLLSGARVVEFDKYLAQQDSDDTFDGHDARPVIDDAQFVPGPARSPSAAGDRR